jgi:hypothetical protein
LWAVIVGESNCTRGDTAVDAVSTVLNIANFGTGNGRCVGASRGDVLGAGRAVLVVTAGRVAVVVANPAV